MAGAQSGLGPKPRIGTGVVWLVLSAILLGIGLFALLASGGEDRGALGAAALCLSLGAGLAGIGLLVRLFGIIERRLIDLREASPRA